MTRMLPAGEGASRVDAYVAAAGIAEARRGALFRCCEPGAARCAARLGDVAPRRTQDDQAPRPEGGLPAEICAHSFRGTGITEYLRNGDDLEVAARIAGHESTRTTQLYNRL